MTKSRKITERDLLDRLREGEEMIPPLKIDNLLIFNRLQNDFGNARLELSWRAQPKSQAFLLKVKARSTPQAVREAVNEARRGVEQSGEPALLPLIQVPYLSPERLEELEQEGVSGVDLCGNGVVVVPGTLLVFRSGAPNPFRESRPLNNPYRGRSALVARMLLTRRRWAGLSELKGAIDEAGGELSLSQVSKAVKAIEEDLLVAKSSGQILLNDPLGLLDRLGREWRGLEVRREQPVRLPKGGAWGRALSSQVGLRWALTGESSASRYTAFSQGGPLRVAVTDLDEAEALLGGSRERVAAFADLRLCEIEDPAAYFDFQCDDEGIHWAGRLQTWLELQSGDARQQDAARDLRQQIIRDMAT